MGRPAELQTMNIVCIPDRTNARTESPWRFYLLALGSETLPDPLRLRPTNSTHPASP